jgi:hypothetical protein
MNETELILADYFLFILFVIFLALVIAVSVKSIVWLAVKLGVIRI